MIGGMFFIVSWMVQKRKQLKIRYIHVPLLEDIFWRNHNANVTFASNIALPKYIKHEHTQIVTVVIDKFFELDILKHINYQRLSSWKSVSPYYVSFDNLGQYEIIYI